MFEARCEVKIKLVDFGWEKVGYDDGHDVGMGRFLSFVQEYFPVGLEEMGSEQEQQVLLGAIGMSLYCGKDGHQMVRGVFQDNWLSGRSVNGLGYEYNVLESCGSKISDLAQTMSLPISFELHTYFHVLMLLEDCT